MQNVSERFWSKVAIGHPDVCWEWKASCNPNGYGQFYIPNRGMSKAHRVALYLTGKLKNLKATKETHVLHKCGNRKCVNPNHLYIGTAKQNMADKKAHGTHVFGEDHPSAKLSNDDIRKVFDLRDEGLSQAQIAEQLDTTRGHVCAIINGRARKAEHRKCNNKPVRPPRLRSKYTEETKQEVRDMLAMGIRQSQVARNLKVPLSFVHSLIRREQIQLPPPKRKKEAN